MKTLIKNIKEIIGLSNNQKSYIKKGKKLKLIESIKDGWILIEDNIIVDYGSMDNWNGVEDWNNLEIIDAENGIVLPTWCDSHTHIVYAGSRENEFVDRINGLSYEEIAERGGGILNSAKLLSKTDEKTIYQQSANRVEKVIKYGTGALEIKSGYGLNIKDEIKMLQIIQELKNNFPIQIKSTFLGAHAVPKNLTKEQYISNIINDMLPEINKQKLADYIDVFCDKGFFNPEETERILEAGKKYGLQPKIHANELDYSGGIQIGVKMNALTVDHLEFTSNKEIEILKKSSTIPTLLPGTAFFLGLKYPPARKIVDSGLPIALATDFNPGSCPTGNMSLIMTLACVNMKLTPTEVINAATINGAYAMGLENSLGEIKKGKIANLIITKDIKSINYIPYSMGENNINKVIINGKIYYDSETNY
ncbi:MAG: imidazolonepropionase [Flavobacteriales bacterium]|jgi:imidazolonepropionase|nr:imidazolonepropionase [Flavobacteriales bacterium]|tara:strand:+ start:14835 stop:16097 length:1263 start_codon:yes stop_codon:yes gene_type:complete